MNEPAQIAVITGVAIFLYGRIGGWNRLLVGCAILVLAASAMAGKFE